MKTLSYIDCYIMKANALIGQLSLTIGKRLSR
jgi:hypothetical protein